MPSVLLAAIPTPNEYCLTVLEKNEVPTTENLYEEFVIDGVAEGNLMRY